MDRCLHGSVLPQSQCHRNKVNLLAQHIQRPKRSRKARLTVRSDAQHNPADKSLAPVQVKTPVGKMLDYYLKMEPHLLNAAIDKQLEALKEEKDRIEGEAQDSGTDSQNLTLYKRINEVRRSEERATLEELMYICVLEKFVTLGVQMMPRVGTFVDSPVGSMAALTEGIHSKEAVEIVKEHVRGMMGQTALVPDATPIKMPKLQAVQMYVMSIMFGYFLRRVDKRFQLERSAGLLNFDDAKEEAVNRLERLFNQADSLDRAEFPDTASTSSRSSSPELQSDTASSNISPGSSKGGQEQSLLQKYIKSFGAETVRDMAKVVSQEAATLIDMQTMALFGDYRLLQKEMENAVGSNIISVEDLMERVKQKIESGGIEVTTFTVGAQRRAVLEAIAFGTFLRDVESSVDSNYGLLTAAKGEGPGGTPPSDGGFAGAV